MLSKKLVAVAIMAGAVSIARSSNAETVVVERETVQSVPNRPMIVSGVLTFGISYGISVIVAATSGSDADRLLLIPIVGPWADLGARQSCPITALSCGHETAAKVGLVFDGVFQAIGALSIVGGFLWRRDVVVTRTTSIQISPFAGPMGSGLMVNGRF